jgi:hypothetical protein
MVPEAFTPLGAYSIIDYLIILFQVLRFKKPVSEAGEDT